MNIFPEINIIEIIIIINMSHQIAILNPDVTD